jgi:diguanylate cyclase (GGDEF)-like protein/PAS domain S-box-containing protein
MPSLSDLSTAPALPTSTPQPAPTLHAALSAATRANELEQLAGFGRWWFDPASSRVALSPTAAQLLEVEPGVYAVLEDALVHVVPDDVLTLMAHLTQGAGQGADCEFRLVHALTGLRWLRLRMAPAAADAAGLRSGVLLDITTSKHAALRERLGVESTRILIGTRTLDTALVNLIALVCEHLGWEWGALWAVDAQAGHAPALMCRHHWHLPHTQLAAFTTDSETVRMGAGEGLVGQVWASGRAAWVEDIAADMSFLRRASALECGLRSGYAFPVALLDADGRRHCFGVLEFFSPLSRQREAQLPNLAEGIGSSVAYTLERFRQQEHLLQLARIDTLKELTHHGQIDALRRAATTRPAAAPGGGAPGAGRNGQLADLIASIDEVLWTLDVGDWSVVYVSPVVERVYGRARHAFYADPNLWLKCVHRADRRHVLAQARQVVAEGRAAFVYRILRPDQEVRWMRYEASFMAGNGAGGRIELVGMDVTEQYHLQQSLHRCHHALRIINDCETLIARSDDERALLRGVCDVLALTYRMAWVGVLHADGSLALAAATGAHQDYLDQLGSSLAAGAAGLGTIGAALRSNAPVVANRIDSDQLLAPWSAAATRRGLHAKLALPLHWQDDVLGVLNIYSQDRDAFDVDEVRLLAGLANRISATMQSYRHRQAQQEAESALRLRERALEASANPIMISSAVAPRYAIEYVNPAFERVTGYARAEVVGRHPDFLLGADREQDGLAEVLAAFRDKREGRAMLRNYRKDGGLYWNDVHIAPVKDDDGEVRHFVLIQYDVTAMKRSESALHRLAHYDALTGLPNRVLLHERLLAAIGAASGGLWLVYLDLDRFKLVNDTLGHRAGDVLLKEIARRLRRAVRPTDTVARLGGDEFVLMFPDMPDEAHMVQAAQRVLDVIAQPLLIDGHEFFPTCSMGAAGYPQDGADQDALMRHADIAMYRAKEAGRNNCQFYASSMNQRMLERLHLEGELRHALERDEFVLHYQPQVALASGRTVGMEALVRWNHPKLGMVPPDRFIGLAEETGLIVAIGAWVMRSACAQNMAWQRAGLPRLRVAVNLSARQFNDRQLIDTVKAVLDETGLPAGDLDIELTESSLMADVDGAVATMHELKALGVQLSIDDFGTGYSSLAYLKRFPIDVLKIDKSFVRDIVASPDDAAIAVSIILLAHTLKLHVIAEGVETVEQMDFLREHGCDDVQGYYLSRPLPAGAVEALFGAMAGSPAPGTACIAHQ